MARTAQAMQLRGIDWLLSRVGVSMVAVLWVTTTLLAATGSAARRILVQTWVRCADTHAGWLTSGQAALRCLSVPSPAHPDRSHVAAGERSSDGRLRLRSVVRHDGGIDADIRGKAVNVKDAVSAARLLSEVPSRLADRIGPSDAFYIVRRVGVLTPHTTGS